MNVFKVIFFAFVAGSLGGAVSSRIFGKKVAFINYNNEADQTFDVKKIRIIDSSGNPRIVIGNMESIDTGIALLGKDGTLQAALILDKESNPNLGLRDRAGNLRGQLGINKDGAIRLGFGDGKKATATFGSGPAGAQLTLGGVESRHAVILSADNKLTKLSFVNGERQKESAIIGFSEETGSFLSLDDEKKNNGIFLSSNKGSSAISVNDSRKVNRVVMAVQEDSPAVLVSEANGDVKWGFPLPR